MRFLLFIGRWTYRPPICLQQVRVPTFLKSTDFTGTTSPDGGRLYGVHINHDAGGGRSAADRRRSRPHAEGQQGLGVGSLLAETALLAGNPYERRRLALPRKRDRRVSERAGTGLPFTAQTPVKWRWPLVSSTQKLRDKWESHTRKDGSGFGDRNGMAISAVPNLILKRRNPNSLLIPSSWAFGQRCRSRRRGRNWRARSPNSADARRGTKPLSTVQSPSRGSSKTATCH